MYLDSKTICGKTGNMLGVNPITVPIKARLWNSSYEREVEINCTDAGAIHPEKRFTVIGLQVNGRKEQLSYNLMRTRAMLCK